MDHYDQTHYQLLFDQRLGANTALNLTLFRVLGAGYYEQYRPDDALSTYGIAPAVINGDSINTTDIIRRRWLDNALTGANASADVKLGSSKLVLGGSYSNYRGQHYGEVIWARYAGNSDIRDRYYDDNAKKTDANAFAKLTYALDPKVDLYGDVQVRNVGYSFLGFNNELDNVTQELQYTFFNPKAGLLWRAGEGGRLMPLSQWPTASRTGMIWRRPRRAAVQVRSVSSTTSWATNVAPADGMRVSMPITWITPISSCSLVR